MFSSFVIRFPACGWVDQAPGKHRAGFTNYSRGHLGHSLGLTQRFEEPPFIAPGEARPVVPNMVLAIEMPYYVYGVGAFQLERMGVVTGTGFDLVDQLPFEFELTMSP